MIWQFQTGKNSNHRSKEAFREGMAMIFTGIDLTDSNWVDAIDFIYDRVRCGLYHDGRARKRVLTSGDFNHPIQINSQAQVIKINPHRLPAAFVTHFKSYIADLRASDENGEIRKNFLKMF